MMGADAIGELLRRRHRPRRRRRRRAHATMPDIEVAAAPQLSTLVFRYRPPGLDEAALATAQRRHPRRALRRRPRAGRRAPRSTAAATSSSPCSTPRPPSTTSSGSSSWCARRASAASTRRRPAPRPGQRLAVATMTHDPRPASASASARSTSAWPASPTRSTTSTPSSSRPRDGFAWHPGMMLRRRHPAGAVPGRPGHAGRPDVAVLLPQLPQGHRPALPVLHPRELLPAAPGVRRLLPWAADRLDSVRLGERVVAVEHDGEAYVVTLRAPAESLPRPATSCSAPARAPRLPRSTCDGPGRCTPPTTSTARTTCSAGGSITVVGSGQSAAEVYADLLAEQDDARLRADLGDALAAVLPDGVHQAHPRDDLARSSPPTSRRCRRPAPGRGAAPGRPRSPRGSAPTRSTRSSTRSTAARRTGGVDTTLLTATEVTRRDLGRARATPSTCTTPSRGRPRRLTHRAPRARHRLRAARPRRSSTRSATGSAGTSSGRYARRRRPSPSTTPTTRSSCRTPRSTPTASSPPTSAWAPTATR